MKDTVNITKDEVAEKFTRIFEQRGDVAIKIAVVSYSIGREILATIKPVPPAA